MSGALIKNVVIAIILVVLAFVVGSLAADGAKESLGVIAACVGVFVLIYMGKRCWWLIFLLPPLLDHVSLPVINKLPVAYIVCFVILVYWLVMRMMGYVRVTWHGVWWMDVMTLVTLIYYACTFYWHPVSLAVFGYDTEYVGGAIYAWCVAAALAYCAFSIIPCSLEELGRILRYAFYLSVGVEVFCTSSWSFNTGYSAAMEVASNDRFGIFTNLGQMLFQWMICKYSLLGIVTSLWKIGLLLIAVFAIILSGFRESLVRVTAFLLFVSVARRQLTLLVCSFAAAYGLLLYLSSEEILVHAPFGVQRVLSMVPGVKVDEAIKRNAEGSSDWRVVMWKWALDPRTGYIKDYVWGDGFGQSVYLLKLTTINLNRGRENYGDQQRFAEEGIWHNGFISSMHRVGLVGWGLMIIWWLCGTFLVLRTCYALRHRTERLYIMYTVMFVPVQLVWMHISAGNCVSFFQTFYYVAITKIAYCCALKLGLMTPLFTRTHYVPLMVRDIEEAAEGRQIRSPRAVVEA